MAFNPNNIHGLVDGSLKKVVGDINKIVKDPHPTFVRMVILDVCIDPFSINDAKVDYWINVLGVSNPRYARILPRNSVIAQRALTGNTEVSSPMFLFPFFPSHLALPCKPGEMVWTMFEDPNARTKELGFWFCKITEANFVEDVNHAHHARQLDQGFNPGIIQQIQGTPPTYDLINGKAITAADGTRFSQQMSEIISYEGGGTFESLVTETEASAMIRYESVPRFRKRPGDIALEGSNNTLIVLGTDRTGPAALYDYEPNSVNSPFVPDSDMVKYAGSIDIVAGRGMKSYTGGTVVDTVRLADGQPIKEELGKHAEVIALDEGNPDLTSDRSRVLVSQRTMVDKNFGLDSYLSEQGISDTEEVGDSAIVIKSDKVRIIARSDISFLVTNYITSEENSLEGRSEFKIDDIDPKNWASITIKSNGDIVFTPSSKGYIKLGGDDAQRAILCTQKSASVNEGIVTALPIATTAGGFVGTDGGKNVDSEAVNKTKKPDLGSFSTKVLIK